MGNELTLSVPEVDSVYEVTIVLLRDGLLDAKLFELVKELGRLDYVAIRAVTVQQSRGESKYGTSRETS